MTIFLLRIILILYISSLIIFDMPENVKYSNILNILFWVCFISIIIISKQNKFYINKFISSYMIFTIFCFASILWAVNIDFTTAYILKLLIVCINIIILYNIFRYYNLENSIHYGILIGSLYNYMIAFQIIHPSFDIYEFNRFIGSVGNSNKLAGIMLLSIFSSLILLNTVKNNWFRIYIYLNILLASYSIFLSISKKAIILAPILLLTTVQFKNLNFKKILIFITILIVTIYISSQYIDSTFLSDKLSLLEKRFSGLIGLATHGDADHSSKERIQLLIDGFELFQNAPIFGIGLDNFRHFLGLYAHNTYLELLVDLGIIGFIIYYAIYIIIIKQILKMENSNLKKLLITMILILLVMDFTTVTYFNKLIIFILLYIFYIAEKNKKILLKD